MQLPYSLYEFIVRDGNNSVWYVNTQVGDSSSPPGGTAMLFAGVNVEAWNGWTVPGVPVVTNVVYETNVVTVTLTNHIVEDPVGTTVYNNLISTNSAR